MAAHSQNIGISALRLRELGEELGEELESDD